MSLQNTKNCDEIMRQFFIMDADSIVACDAALVNLSEDKKLKEQLNKLKSSRKLRYQPEQHKVVIYSICLWVRKELRDIRILTFNWHKNLSTSNLKTQLMNHLNELFNLQTKLFYQGVAGGTLIHSLLLIIQIKKWRSKHNHSSSHTSSQNLKHSNSEARAWLPVV